MGPTSCLTFLGFEIDTMSCEVQLPEAKLAALHHTLLSWIARKSCMRKELESIIGRLAHANHVVQPGKTFMSRLFALLSSACKAHHHIRLSQATRSDMLWWATFVSTWNEISFIRPYTSGQFLHEIRTDALSAVVQCAQHLGDGSNYCGLSPAKANGSNYMKQEFLCRNYFQLY